jgi:hypothetical protein
VSRFKAAEHGDYETWWAAMGANHIEQEKEYVDNLVQIVDIGKDADKKGQSTSRRSRPLHRARDSSAAFPDSTASLRLLL